MTEGLAEFIQMHGIETRQVNGCGYLVMYKAVRMDFGSWYNRCFPKKDKGAYSPGTTVRCRKWTSNRNMDCGLGLHVGSLRFARVFRRLMGDHHCMRMRIVEVLVHHEDVVCVPRIALLDSSDGKIRCRQLTVLRTIARKR